MIETEFYKEHYKKASGRVLYLLAKKHYGSLPKLSEFLGVTRQYIQQLIEDGIPANYAGVLGRKHGFNPAILSYENALVIGISSTYPDLFLQEQIKKLFSPRDIKYILRGTYINNAKKYVAIVDAKTVK